jgi:hypothetical protein
VRLDAVTHGAGNSLLPPVDDEETNAADKLILALLRYIGRLHAVLRIVVIVIVIVIVIRRRHPVTEDLVEICLDVIGVGLVVVILFFGCDPTTFGTTPLIVVVVIGGPLFLCHYGRIGDHLKFFVLKPGALDFLDVVVINKIVDVRDVVDDFFGFVWCFDVVFGTHDATHSFSAIRADSTHSKPCCGVPLVTNAK